MLFDKRDEIEIDISDYKKLTDTVYEYIEPVTEKKFILKIQEEPFDNPKEDEELLFQEFRKLVYLSNEAEIATVNYLVKISDNRIGYLMEYVEGVTLKEYLDKNTITLDEAVDIIYHICLAIEKSHSMNVFHNDLEHMNNILINDLGFIKIIDFLDLTIYKQKETDKKDIESIKKISKILFLKLEKKEDQRVFLEIYSYILKIENIKNVSKNIILIYETLSDILQFSPYIIRFFIIIAPLIKKADKDFYFFQQSFKIEKNKLNISTGLLEEVSALQAIKNKYTILLQFIESMGYLGQTKMSIEKIDNDYYHYKIGLFFTPKILKCNKVINRFNLLNHYSTLNDLTRSVHDYTFENLDKLFTEKSYLNSTEEEN